MLTIRTTVSTLAVIGILTCDILELAFAHLLKTDADVARLTVLAHERVLLVVSPIMTQASMLSNTGAFNSVFGLRKETRRARLQFLENAWQAANAHVGASTGW